MQRTLPLKKIKKFNSKFIKSELNNKLTNFENTQINFISPYFFSTKKDNHTKFPLCHKLGSPNKPTKKSLKVLKKDKYTFISDIQKESYDKSTLIVRMAMRFPNEEMHDHMINLFYAIKNTLIDNRPDDVLSCIHEGSKENSRGGFHDVNHIRQFFAKQPKTIPTSILLSKLESFLSGIGYFYRDVVSRKIISLTAAQQNFIHTLITDVKFVDPINKKFNKRNNHITYSENESNTWTEKYTTNVDFTSDISSDEGATNDYQKDEFKISDTDSDSDDDNTTTFTPIRQKVMPPRHHLTNKGTHAHDVLKHNLIPMTAQSGTAPLIAPIVEWLATKNHNLKPLLNDDYKLLNFLTLVFATTFHRADFHSIHEVLDGLKYYFEEKNKAKYTYYSPVELTTQGLKILKECIITDDIKIIDKNNKVVDTIKGKELDKELNELIDYIEQLCYSNNSTPKNTSPNVLKK